MKQIREKMAKYDFLIVIILAVLLFLVAVKLDNTKTEIYYQNVINISITMSGFLLTLFTIWGVFPDNNFIRFIKEKTKIAKRLNLTIFIGIVTLLFACVSAFFYLDIRISIMTMLVGLAETFLATVNFYRLLRANEHLTKDHS